MLACLGRTAYTGNVSRRIKKKSSLKGAYFLASLNSFEVTRIRKLSEALMKGHSAVFLPSSLPLHWLLSSGKTAQEQPFRVRMTLLVLGLQVQLHQPPAQELPLAGDTDDGRPVTDLANQPEADHAVR